MPTFTKQTGTDSPVASVGSNFFAAPTLVDIDGDNDFDIVLGRGNGQIRYFENRGTVQNPIYTGGTSNPFSALDVGTHSAPTLVDVDGDGNLDVVAGARDGTLKYYQYDTTTNSYVEVTGSASPFNGFTVGEYSAPTFADIDGDTDLDVVVGAEDGTLRYYERTSTGVYTAVVGSANPFDGIDVGTRSAPTFADIDGDGRTDLVVGAADGTLNYFRNLGTSASPSYTLQTGSDNPFDGFDVGSLSKPTFADIDNDGDLDAIVGAEDGNLTYFENKTPVPVVPTFTKQTGTDNPVASVGSNRFAAPTLVDIDGDNDFDIVLGRGNGQIRYFENRGTVQNPIYTGGASNPFSALDVGTHSAPTLVDVDSDNKLDAVAGARDGTLKYYRYNTTTTSYTEVTGSASPFNGFTVGEYSAPTFADIDGDTDLDMVVGAADGTLRYYERTSTGGYTAVVGSANPFDGIDVGTRSAPTFADIDGDGSTDLVVGAADGTLNYFRNLGTSASPSYTLQTGSDNPFDGFDVGSLSKPTFADIDNDGDLDAIVGAEDGNLTYFENRLIDLPKIKQNAGVVTVTGTASNDALTISESGGNLIFDKPNTTISLLGFVPPIIINLGSGDDILDASTTGQRLNIFGGAGNDTIKGGKFNDLISGGPGADNLNGGLGLDVLDYSTSAVGVTVDLGSSNPTGGDAEGDTISNFESVSGSEQNDELTGDNNRNVLRGNGGNDTLIGVAGNNLLDGGAGDDVLIGGTSNDRLVGSEGSDIYFGGADRDTVDFSDSAVAMVVNLASGEISDMTGARGTIFDVENVDGSAGDDVLTGDAAGNQLRGNDGDDTLLGGGSRDHLHGGTGADYLEGGSGSDFLRGDNGDDILFGGIDIDYLFGGADNDILVGEEGNDSLMGESGNDLLIGGQGRDKLTGGGGRDYFYFESLSDSLLPSRDRITDFRVGTDTLVGPNAVAPNKINQLGMVNRLNQFSLQMLLTTEKFKSDTAATFTFGARTFVAINDGTAGFSASSDAVIEITGYSGSLSNLSISDSSALSSFS